MTEKSRFWDGTAVGDATEAPYDAPTEFAVVQMAMTGADFSPNKGGVFLDDLNLLAPTSPSANTCRIASGKGQVYGTWYHNDANVDTTIPTPASATRIDRMVLRKSWASQTVRITRIAGTEGAGVPAMTQTAGTTWDVPLCQVSITTGGAITITSERYFLGAARTLLFDSLDLNGVATWTTPTVPTGFSSFEIIWNGRSDATPANNSQVQMRFNGDTGANYDHAFGGTTGVAAVNAEALAATYIQIGNVSSSIAGNATGASGEGYCLIPRYNDTSFKKTCIHRWGFKVSTDGASAGLQSYHGAGYWRNTNAITSITILLNSGNFLTGSRIKVYGVV